MQLGFDPVVVGGTKLTFKTGSPFRRTATESPPRPAALKRTLSDLIYIRRFTVISTDESLKLPGGLGLTLKGNPSCRPLDAPKKPDTITCVLLPQFEVEKNGWDVPMLVM
jgi:hypothetical protein